MQLLAVVASWLVLLNPLAAGKATPGLTITASGSTSIGLQVFANSNLSGGAGPTGSIVFRLFGPGDTSCASAIFTSTVPVAGTSMNSAHYTTAAAGTYRWTSTYSGDTNNNPVGPTSCADPNASVVVTGAHTALSVTAPAPVGGAIHGAATLGGGLQPSGSITFYLSGPGDTFCAQTIFNTTVPVAGNGGYISANLTPSTTGTYRWRASYTGDANNMATPMTACLDPNDAVDVTSVNQPPAASVNPTSLTFTAQVLGASSAAQTVTMSNSGGSNLLISTVARGGAGAADFTVSNDHCTGAAVAPGGTCTVAVAFTPSSIGTRSASLSFTDNAAGSPQVVALNGQATADRGLLTYPLAGQSGVDTTQAFTWALAAPAQGYILVVGTTQYGTDLLNSGILPAGQAAFNVPALPTGRTLYATLLTETGGAWTLFQAITFTAAPGLATFTSPVNGQTKVAKAPVFSWATIPQAQGYILVVGTTQFGTDIANSGVLPAGQASFSGVSLPPGKTLYATILTKTSGSWTRYQAITFTTA